MTFGIVKRRASNEEAGVLTRMLVVKAAVGCVLHCHVCSRLAAAATRGGMGPSRVMSQAETWDTVSMSGCAMDLNLILLELKCGK